MYGIKDAMGNPLRSTLSRGTIISIAVAVLLAVSLIGMASYVFVVYTPQISQKDAIIADQHQSIADLNATVGDLNRQITNLQGQLNDMRQKYTANLVTALGVKEISSSPASHLYIAGSVKNTGVVAAYDSGLKIVAYGEDREVLINMTAPLNSAAAYQSGFSAPMQLSTVYPTQSLGVTLNIFHSGNVTDWEITPVSSGPP